MKSKRGTLRTVLVVTALVALLGSRPARADDRLLLYTKPPISADVMILVSNTETMATCVPGQPMANGFICSSSAPQPSPFGMSDDPASKLGSAKWAINYMINNFGTQFNFGVASFSVNSQLFNKNVSKRYAFVALDDSFTSTSWAYEPAGTMLNFGPAIGTPNTLSVGSGSTARTYEEIQVGSLPGAETWVLKADGTQPYQQPYVLGQDVMGSERTLIYNPNGSGSLKKQEVVVTYSSTTQPGSIPFEITQCVLDCTIPTDPGFDGQTITVRKDLVQCATAAPCDPSGLTIQATSSVRYAVPPTYCSETNSSCNFPTVYGYGSQIGQEMGWTDYSTDVYYQANESGWLFHPNVNPQPVVMIGHGYAPWTPSGGDQTPANGGKWHYTQDSNPCILRAMRPAAADINNGTSSGSSKTVGTDHYPTFVPSLAVDGTNPSSLTALAQTSCDQLVDGRVQSGNATNDLAVIVPRADQGSGPPMVKVLTDAYYYYNGGNSGCSTAGGGIDGFCGGVRPDDPFRNCRASAIILITDSINAASPAFSYGAKTDPTGQLSSIHVPAFVIGYAPTAGQLGNAGDCTLGSGLPGNTGQCIADYTGATTYNGTNVVRQGYFLATKPADLVNALTNILNQLNENTRDFATATIPSVSSTSEGVAYLSMFNPQNNRSVWSGHLRAFYLNPTTGLIQTTSTGLPDPTKFVFWSGTNPFSGSLIWDAGDSGADTPGIFGNLDAARNVNPSQLLTSSPGAGNTWSDNVHDQATGVVGRNVFFGLRPGDGGCGSSTAECLVQVPVGSGGAQPAPGATEPSGGWGAPPSPPSPLPAWWSTVQSSPLYAHIINTLSLGSEAGNNVNQGLQNSFSFLRGNRDPVVEDQKIANSIFSVDPTCAKILADTSYATNSPCYYGDTVGDIFHSNPAVESFPNNFRYFFAQDPNSVCFGTYGDRPASQSDCTKRQSYQNFFTSYAHRRKILYAGADDGLFHAYDIGVYNGDTSSYTSSGNTISPLLGHYDLGTGREIFAYAPRAGLNKAYAMAHTISQDWTIDGAPALDDVYIDESRIGNSPEGIAPSGTGADLGGTSPKWRTVLVGTEREGGLLKAGGGIVSGTPGRGGSLFALDVTDPDQAVNMTQSDTGGHRGVPQCVVSDFTPGSTSVPSGCNAAYPQILWEIRDDQIPSSSSGSPAELAGSLNATTQDLGMTWSRPVIGRVSINVSSGTPRDFFVAIFGGGYDHSGNSISNTNGSGNTGNFLYMVDIETGQIIYKKNLGVSLASCGTSTAGCLPAGLPGEPAAVDINNDGYIDRIYIGDTQGRLWRVDLTQSATMSGGLVQSSDWKPVLFFDEFANATPPLGVTRQPVFTRPSVFLINTSTNGTPVLGVAFGTGDRDNMPVLADTNPNWFVVLSDPPVKAQTSWPVTLADLQAASLTTNACNSTNCLNQNGFYDTLSTTANGAEIVNTNSLAFNQAIYFDTFLRTTVPGNCNEVGEAFFYKINYLTGESLYTVNGTIVPNIASGSEVGSDPIVYQDVNTWVVSATDNTVLNNVGGGAPPAVTLKSWKEQ